MQKNENYYHIKIVIIQACLWPRVSVNYAIDSTAYKVVDLIYDFLLSSYQLTKIVHIL